MTEYTEDDFMPLLEQLDEKHLFAGSTTETVEGCVEIANHYAPHSGAGEDTIKASAIYALGRLMRNGIRRHEVASLCGVSPSTISRTWHEMAEVAVRKDDEIDIDSEELMSRL